MLNPPPMPIAPPDVGFKAVFQPARRKLRPARPSTTPYEGACPTALIEACSKQIAEGVTGRLTVCYNDREWYVLEVVPRGRRGLLLEDFISFCYWYLPLTGPQLQLAKKGLYGPWNLKKPARPLNPKRLKRKVRPWNLFQARG